MRSRFPFCKLLGRKNVANGHVECTSIDFLIHLPATNSMTIEEMNKVSDGGGNDVYNVCPSLQKSEKEKQHQQHENKEIIMVNVF